jgi:predicted O-methyltransferase YrrM
MQTTPELVTKIQAVGARGNFHMSSEPAMGALLRTLAATKPGGRLLEIGAGIGVGSAWILDGMDADARLTGLEVHEGVAAVCRDLLRHDERVEIITTDSSAWLAAYHGPKFDFVFIDTTITKFDRRDLVYPHLARGAILVADDLLPQSKWTDDHLPRVEQFRREIVTEPYLVPTLVDWASGVLVAAYRP